jgi:hypothetical protein
MDTETGDIPLAEWFDMLLQGRIPPSVPGSPLPVRTPGEALHHAMLDVEEGPVPVAEPGLPPGTADGVLRRVTQLKAERDEALVRAYEAEAQLKKAAQDVARAEKCRAGLADVLRLFQVDESGWARSVHVSLDDFNGWLALAGHGRVPHAA